MFISDKNRTQELRVSQKSEPNANTTWFNWIRLNNSPACSTFLTYDEISDTTPNQAVYFKTQTNHTQIVFTNFAPLSRSAIVCFFSGNVFGPDSKQ